MFYDHDFIFSSLQRPEDALRSVDKCLGLEALAVSVHALISMDRPDLASYVSD